MKLFVNMLPLYGVALLAEGVDRNKIALTDPNNIMVALLAEGVDRNFLVMVNQTRNTGRPPRGGRG